jgi:hypothetical protein
MRRTKLAITTVVIALFTLGVASPAMAASGTTGYVNQVAQALGQNPVYVDPSAKPSISTVQAQQLDTTIKQSGKPIYLILIDNSETKQFSNGPSEFLADVHAELGASAPAFIAVSTAKGFYANGFDMSSSAANAAGQDASSLVQQAGSNPDPFAVYSKWVTAMSKESLNAQPAPTPQAPPFNWGLFWLIVGIILGVIVIIVVIAVLVARAARKKEESEDAARAKRQQEADEMYNKLSPRQRKHSVIVEDGEGNLVTLDKKQYKPSTLQTATHNNYYGGGYYGGMYYGPGYYSDPFWTWLLVSEVASNNFGGDRDYNQGTTGGGNYDSSGSSGSDFVTSGTTGGSDWGSGGGYDSGSTGGGDWGGGGGFDSGSFGGGDSGGGGGSW